MDKKELRKEMNQWFQDIPKSQLETLSRKVSETVTATEIWKRSPDILLFLSFGKEFETSYCIEKAFSKGKRVAVPRIYGKEMKFHYISSLKDPMEVNRWGIREPLISSEIWKPQEMPSLMLTPGLAFGLKGERLGRGGGFYDRFLGQYNSHLTTVALSFNQQIRENIPVEDFDVRLDYLCSEDELILCS